MNLLLLFKNNFMLNINGHLSELFVVFIMIFHIWRHCSVIYSVKPSHYLKADYDRSHLSIHTQNKCVALSWWVFKKFKRKKCEVKQWTLLWGENHTNTDISVLLYPQSLITLDEDGNVRQRSWNAPWAETQTLMNFPFFYYFKFINMKQIIW